MPVTIDWSKVERPTEAEKIFWKALDAIAFGNLSSDESKWIAIRALNKAYAVSIKAHQKQVDRLSKEEIAEYVADELEVLKQIPSD